MDKELYEAFERFRATDITNAYSALVNMWRDDPKDQNTYKLIYNYRLELQKMARSGMYDFDEIENALHYLYILTAREKFDDFMIAVEWNREPQERFWLPRRKQLMVICNALQALADDRLDELFISQPPRTGKALANDTPILTRKGWKNHGDLVVGDEVIGMQGQFKKVIAVHPKCQLDCLVEFTNGEKIQCHENHEWKVIDRRDSHHFPNCKNMETHLLEGHIDNSHIHPEGERGHRYNFMIPSHIGVTGEEKELPLDPYTLGVWLGDGANRNPRICGDKGDYAIIQSIIDNGHPIRWQVEHKTTGVMYYDFDIRKELRSMGMCHSRKTTPKHIPQEYLTASYQQRLELLAGLLDTDGTLRAKEHRYTFSTADLELRDTFVELVSTFGWRTCVVEYAPTESSTGIKATRPCYAVSFNPTEYIPCRLERKQLREYAKQRNIAIKSITRVAPKEGNCITVEGDGMYLAGRTMIPTHNTTLVQFFTIWEMLRDPEKANLYVSYSSSVAKTYYEGVLEILNDPYTYDWQAIFPERTLESTNALDSTLNIDRRKRYATLSCVSVEGSLNGRLDCNGLAVADDLHEGIEEAMSPDRLAKKWSTVENNYISRWKSGCKRLWIGTRWSVHDCISHRIDFITSDVKCRNIRFTVVNVPALDKNDESNFDYLYGVGFSTNEYHQRRASFERNNDLASWTAQYMGSPIERMGTVFSVDDMRYFKGNLPEDVEPDLVFMSVDPAWGGGDYVASPVCYKFGDDVYVVDVVYDNSEKKVTQPKICQKAKKWGVQLISVEATKTTSSYSEGISDLLKEMDYSCRVSSNTKTFTGEGKAQRIFNHAPEIREHFIFLDGDRSKEYDLFMANVYSFKVEGKNKHDDAPDSLAMACEEVFGQKKKNIIRIGKRSF